MLCTLSFKYLTVNNYKICSLSISLSLNFEVEFLVANIMDLANYLNVDFIKYLAKSSCTSRRNSKSSSNIYNLHKFK